MTEIRGTGAEGGGQTWALGQNRFSIINYVPSFGLPTVDQRNPAPPQKQYRAHGYIVHSHHHFTLPGKPSVLFLLGNFTPKTSNYCLKNMALGFARYVDIHKQ